MFWFSLKKVEIGSGYSSAVMLDVNDLFFERQIELIFIEPHPERLNSLIERGQASTGQAVNTKTKILPAPVQDVPMEIFRELEPNDILFVDSSHVLKPGSDVAHILFNIMPSLGQGVIVHFHDIPWPFEYPLEWYIQGISCNEAHYLRAYLQYNAQFHILFFNDFLAKRYTELCREKLPQLLADTTTGLWLWRAA